MDWVNAFASFASARANAHGDKVIPHPPRLRFGIRSLLAMVLVASIFAAFPVLLLVVLWPIWFTGPLIALATFAIVRNAIRSDPDETTYHPPSLAGWIVLSIAFTPLLASWFIRHRWVNVFVDKNWPRQFPYPDHYLVRIHAWWDRLNPAPPGTLKLHGEYFVVLQGANALVLVACLICGVVAGYVFPKRRPFRITAGGVAKGR